MDRFSSVEQRRDLRLGMARRQVPVILGWAGGLTLAFLLVNVVTTPGASALSRATNLLFGPLFLGLVWAIHRGLVGERLVPWVWASSILLLVVMLAMVFYEQPSAANLSYIVLVMTAFGPMTHAWLPFWLSGAGMLVVVLATFLSMPDAEVAQEGLVCLAALLVSAVLLRLRMMSLDDMVESQARLDHQATYDPLTDVLNRNGLQRAIPGVSAAAARSGAQILVWFVDVRGLKLANDLHGHVFGDAMIRATADALRACVRGNDVVARWGGDEFVVIGEGTSGWSEDLGIRVNAELGKDVGVTGDFPRAVTVGFASGPGEADVADLIARADADMYRRRSDPLAGESR